MNKDLEWYRNQVKYLLQQPQPQQKSPEWFKARHNRITASEAASCLFLTEEICKPYVEAFNIKKFKYNPSKSVSHYDSYEDYIIKKCSSFYNTLSFKDTIYTLHGKKYEDIALRLYKKKFNTDVYEFGLLQHPTEPYLAASPDGITPDGIMIEIKCPYSRKIQKNEPPIWYYIQMMCQLEVANLDRCDFLECEIKELSYDDFIKLENLNNNDYGILINNINEDDNSPNKYIYPPLELNTIKDYITWSSNILTQNQECIFFIIEKWHVIEVYRNPLWFNSIKHYFKQTMDIIQKYQSNKELFDNFCESIYLQRNKYYIDKYNSTECLIDNNEEELINDIFCLI